MLQNLGMLSDLLESKGVPYPKLVATGGAVFEVLIGAIVIAGYWLPIAFAALAIFVGAATIMVHNFWTESGAQRANDINAAISNVIIVGALLALARAVGMKRRRL
jgi:putative oxidoreductase